MRSTSIYNVFDQFLDFLMGIVSWFWDTIELLVDICLEFLTRTLELMIVLMNLIFQVICFLRDLCIEAMQTFANVFHGIVNVIGSITCDDVEDFASACIVVLLWLGAFKVVFSVLNQRPRAKRGLGVYKRSRNHLTLTLYTEVCNCFIPKRRLWSKNQNSGFSLFNPFAKADPMECAAGSIKIEDSLTTRRATKRRGMARRRGRRRYNSPCT